MGDFMAFPLIQGEAFKEMKSKTQELTNFMKLPTPTVAARTGQ